jgi:hypothetical protein
MIDNNRTNRSGTIRNTTTNRTSTKSTFNTIKVIGNTIKTPNTTTGLYKNDATKSNIDNELSILHKDIKNLVETTSVDTIAIIEENINNKIDDLYNKIDEDRRKDLDYMRNYILSAMGVGLTAIGLMDMIMFILLVLFN